MSKPAHALALLCCGLLTLAGSALLLAGEGEKPAQEPTDAKQAATAADRAAAVEKDVTQGALRIVDEDASVVECPLTHTDVAADISGFIARVKVTQMFVNPTDEKIEAVYVFPLPNEAAVDDMTMVIGERRIVGLIKRRDDARAIYQQAIAAGQTAALLEQERPNIFTQSVGNIEPGQEVRIEISYVDVLKYDMGTYEFHFPMVVGPRYNPGAPTTTPAARPIELQDKVSPPDSDTTDVPDASKINPPVLKPGLRNGHDISLSVQLDAGVPIQDLKTANHKVGIDRQGERKAKIVLSPNDSLPNKDFVLRYDVVGKKPEMAVLAHTGDYQDTKRLGDGYFMLMVQPQEDERLKKSPPREIVFLIDTSGSMRGAPTAKVIDSMRNMLGLCREGKDTVQVVAFAGSARKLFDKAVDVTPENIKKALNFTDGIRGAGGTEMLKGIKMVIDEPLDKERMRIVVMLSDGYIGNEAQIIEHVGKNCGDQIRFWAVGVGSSPNMFLIDGVAKQGGGMGKRLGLQDDTVALTQEIMTRIQRAQLAKIRIDWGDHEVLETFPARIPELWAGRPVVVFGRYRGAGTASEIKIQGNVEGEDVSWPLLVSLPKEQKQNDVLAKVWARRKIEDLMHSTFYAGSPAVEEEVTGIALNYRLMSQYTSFVAVDQKEVGSLSEPARPPRRMLVPVPLPDGTQWEGFFGPAGEMDDEADATGGFVFGLRQNADRGIVADARGRWGTIAANRAGTRRNVLAKRITPMSAAPMPALALAPNGAANGPHPTAPGSFALGGLGKSRALQQHGQGFGGGGGLGGAGYFGPSADGAPAGSAMLGRKKYASRALGEKKSEELDEFSARESRLHRMGVENRYKKARAAAKEVQLLTKDKADAAKIQQALLRAFYLDQAAANAGYGDGSTAAAALAQIEQRRAERIAGWIKARPALDKKLDLVLRDVSIADALAQIGKAAGVDVKLLEGSVADAASLSTAGGPRVTYLDLRGATLAQALDWLLQPARLDWRLDDGAIVAGSARRLPGVSAWVYDVATLVRPTKAELGEEKDQQKLLKKQQALTSAFLAALQKEFGAEKEIDWFGPGQLLVIGDLKRQQAAGQLLTLLADSNAKPPESLIALHKQTVARAAAHGPVAEKLREAGRIEHVAMTVDAFGWPLLSSATIGQTNDEALTELEIAWRDPAMAKLLDSDAGALALKSFWQINEAAAASPDDARLQKLAATARKLATPTAEKALAAFKANRDDVSAYARALYAALALGRNDANVQESFSLLAAPRDAKSPLHRVAILADALLSEKVGDAQTQALTQLVGEPAGSEELVVLTALACRRAGGEAWSAFRRNSDDILGKAPLRGDVIVLISRLAGSRLPSTLASR
jgi:Ca-activated chloride channel family protein